MNNFLNLAKDFFLSNDPLVFYLPVSHLWLGNSQICSNLYANNYERDTALLSIEFDDKNAIKCNSQIMLFFYFKETLKTNDLSFIKSSHRRQECLRNWFKMREEALFSVNGIVMIYKKKFLHKGQTFSKDISYC